MNAIRKSCIILLSLICPALTLLVLTISCIETAAISSVEKQPLSLPFVMEDTALVVEMMMLYEGPYLEDPDKGYVVDVAGVVVDNQGEEDLALARIALQCGDERYYFEGTDIAAGQRIMLLDKGGKIWNKVNPQSYTGFCVLEEQICLLGDQIDVCDLDMGTVSLTNRTGFPLYDLKVYYRNWYKEDDLYLGGRVHEISVDRILPQESIVLHPEYYASGYSKIVKIVSK